MFYKSVVVECSTGTEDLAKAIEKKAEEMMKKVKDMILKEALEDRRAENLRAARVFGSGEDAPTQI